jgi:hypothetical protein
MINVKKTFNGKIEDKEVELAVKSPDRGIAQEAQLHFGKIFAQSLKAGAILKTRLEDYMKEQGVWNDEKQKMLDKCNRDISDGALKLQKGGIKLSEAKKIALDIRNARNRRLDVLSERMVLEANTAEGQATNSRFNFIVSKCLVYNDNGNTVFKDFDEFLEHINDSYVVKACELLSNILYDLDENFDKDLPENKFLREWKFIDDKLRFINKDGHLTDEEGRLINEDGRYVNAEGKFVDITGNLLTEDGKFVTESKPFLDDDGNPLSLSTTNEEVSAKKNEEK